MERFTMSSTRIRLQMRPALELGSPRRSTIPSRRSYATKQSGPTAQFYKTFTRPIAKVLLLAVFTYQLSYWTWVKLEQDEVKAGHEGTIQALEKKVTEYKQSKKEQNAKS